MLADWLELPGALDQVTAWSKVAQLDLVSHGTTSPAQVIRDTAIAQPLLTASALLSYQAWQAANPGVELGAVAGHSVGEFAAAAIAGVLSYDAAISAVAARGRAMAACAKSDATGMAAVVGGELSQVLAAIDAAGATPANFNGPGQVVAGGTIEALDRLADNPSARTRVVRLEVAGAFHTNHMAGAQSELAKTMARLPTQDALCPLITGGDAVAMTSGAGIVKHLIDQVTQPVRWDLVQQTLLAMGATEVLELAPGAVLSSLAKRGLPGVRVLSLNSQLATV